MTEHHAELYVQYSSFPPAICFTYGSEIDMGFPGSSAGKESACSAGDPGSIPGSERFPGEEKDYPLQHSWAPLVAQTVKNLPATRETWVPSLGWEEPLEGGHSNPLQYPCLEYPYGQWSLAVLSSWGCKESDTTEQRSTAQCICQSYSPRVSRPPLPPTQCPHFTFKFGYLLFSEGSIR